MVPAIRIKAAITDVDTVSTKHGDVPLSTQTSQICTPGGQYVILGVIVLQSRNNNYSLSWTIFKETSIVLTFCYILELSFILSGSSGDDCN